MQLFASSEMSSLDEAKAKFFVCSMIQLDERNTIVMHKLCVVYHEQLNLLLQLDTAEMDEEDKSCIDKQLADINRKIELCLARVNEKLDLYKLVEIAFIARIRHIVEKLEDCKAALLGPRALIEE